MESGGECEGILLREGVGKSLGENKDKSALRGRISRNVGMRNGWKVRTL